MHGWYEYLQWLGIFGIPVGREGKVFREGGGGRVTAPSAPGSIGYPPARYSAIPTEREPWWSPLADSAGGWGMEGRKKGGGVVPSRGYITGLTTISVRGMWLVDMRIFYCNRGYRWLLRVQWPSWAWCQVGVGVYRLLYCHYCIESLMGWGKKKGGEWPIGS